MVKDAPPAQSEHEYRISLGTERLMTFLLCLILTGGAVMAYFGITSLWASSSSPPTLQQSK